MLLLLGTDEIVPVVASDDLTDYLADFRDSIDSILGDLG
jgi:hypothetical protein